MPQKYTRLGSKVQPLPVNPASVARLELLIASRVMDLSAIAEVISGDPGLRARMFRTLREADAIATPLPSVEECVIELGREGMRQCLGGTRLKHATERKVGRD
jgi:hypothetical protein